MNRPTIFKNHVFINNKINKFAEWNRICLYLRSPICNGIRKSICDGCGGGKLYDKNDKVYFVSKHNTVDEVKNIVSTILAINSE